jgi:glycine betaine transporter
MLLVGGLTALQQAAILGSVPFTFVIIGVAYCWIKALRTEVLPGRVDSGGQPPRVAPAEQDRPPGPNVGATAVGGLASGKGERR